MNIYFVISALLVFLMGVFHSILGEKYFLAHLFQRELLREVGNEVFVNRTTRIAWHLTTLAWLGAAGVLFALASHDTSEPVVAIVANVIAVVFFASALLSLIGSRGRHLSWIVFLIIAITTWLGV